MSDSRSAFLAGERHDDVALFLAESFVDDERLERFGERVDGGVVIVVEGDRGRNAFEAATGLDAMEFAGTAMDREGTVADDLAGGTCPDADGGDHDVQFVFAFTEAQNEEIGGIYAEGDVVHAYARCECGTAYSDRWNAGDVDGE
ncbi:DUF5807 family protein [Natrialbaceae archaeon AArc-T1-2]|uniref:DUF5807 family protein n=1 Tax=Natrialbaceae archaeon AArc-T1-2 TaxID=3053904 RepID=UPI00255AC6AF|nr:DUF5807 family protein [Natrialbaceae archaeon AArc-T1-2]WIV67131.1 DUF5807 family protein [Natrialbaceae archaeon AArc-T1-2]